jgi:hypothetical protein
MATGLNSIDEERGSSSGSPRPFFGVAMLVRRRNRACPASFQAYQFWCPRTAKSIACPSDDHFVCGRPKGAIFRRYPIYAEGDSSHTFPKTISPTELPRQSRGASSMSTTSLPTIPGCGWCEMCRPSRARMAQGVRWRRAIWWPGCHFIGLASGGIEVNPEQCIQWLDTIDDAFTQSLARLGLLREGPQSPSAAGAIVQEEPP